MADAAGDTRDDAGAIWSRSMTAADPSVWPAAMGEITSLTTPRADAAGDVIGGAASGASGGGRVTVVPSLVGGEVLPVVGSMFLGGLDPTSMRQQRRDHEE